MSITGRIRIDRNEKSVLTLPVPVTCTAVLKFKA
jgi:hypothetical protein